MDLELQVEDASPTVPQVSNPKFYLHHRQHSIPGAGEVASTENDALSYIFLLKKDVIEKHVWFLFI